MTIQDKRTSELVDLLRNAGMRVTPQRLEIVSALVHGSHPSAEEIYEQVSTKLPTTSLATVYNTLEALKSLGQVLEVRPPQGGIRYDVLRPYGHSHLVCKRCGRVEDAPQEIVENGEVSLKVPDIGWSDLEIRLDLEGICPYCREVGADG